MLLRYSSSDPLLPLFSRNRSQQVRPPPCGRRGGPPGTGTVDATLVRRADTLSTWNSSCLSSRIATKVIESLVGSASRVTMNRCDRRCHRGVGPSMPTWPRRRHGGHRRVPRQSGRVLPDGRHYPRSMVALPRLLRVSRCRRGPFLLRRWAHAACEGVRSRRGTSRTSLRLRTGPMVKGWPRSIYALRSRNS